MSTKVIIDLIRGHCASNNLYAINPLVPTDKVVRKLYVSPEIYQKIVGPWSSAREEAEWNTVRAIMDSFVAGRLLSLPLKKNKERHNFSRLIPLNEGVWELRATLPKPGLRIVGAFVEKDFFVALSWDQRKILNMFGSKQWRSIILRCQTKWRNLFFNYQCLKKEEYDDYLTNIIVN